MEHVMETNVATSTVKDVILISNNLIEIPKATGKRQASKDVVATIFTNLAYYGYTLSKASIETLTALDRTSIQLWWNNIDAALKEITGDNRNMGEYVVYKNFPQEVLEMSEAEYWFNQVLMYVGLPNEWFTTEAKDREPIFPKDSLKVLHLANENSLSSILDSLLKQTTRWNRHILGTVYWLIDTLKPQLTATAIPFKENLVKVVEYMMVKGTDITMKSATDVLRLAIVLSDGDLNSTKPTKFRNFKKKERRFFLGLLEKSTALEEDMARDVEVWKRFMHNLHAGDYKNRFPKTVTAASKLYVDDIHSFNSKLDMLIKSNTVVAVTYAAKRPGEFMRRIKQLSILFGSEVLNEFGSVAERLTVGQLLKLKKYLETCNSRKYRLFPPKGNWTKVRVVENSGKKFPEAIRLSLIAMINITVKTKVQTKLNVPVLLDERTTNIKLNASDSTAYGRGTVFPIPDDVKFIRTASYWENKTFGNNWFDNGWNFYNQNWESVGDVAWNQPKFGDAALFSGDPTNSKTTDGKACQLIDLYLDKLARAGVRYAVWSVLCYSKIKFKDATDVFAALQWGTDANKGKLFEPSRSQIAFPLKDDNYAKFIAYVDIAERKLVYMDANLKAEVNSAVRNAKKLVELMPGIVEYLATIPSVHDLFQDVTIQELVELNNKVVIPVCYDDKNLNFSELQPVVEGEEPKEVTAYVFKPLNENNKFKQLDLNELLK
jgi:hypothetical protein